MYYIVYYVDVLNSVCINGCYTEHLLFESVTQCIIQMHSMQCTI